MNADSDHDPDVLVAGETLVDMLPDSPGPLPEVERFTRRAGGAPANVAVGLARLDAPPYFATRLGGDPFGDFLAGTLDAEGVPDRLVVRDDDRVTTLAFVSHDADGSPTFSFYRENAADRYLAADDVPAEVLEEVSWLYVGGVALAEEPGRSETFALVDRARAAGCSVAFDPNRRPELWATDALFAEVTGWMVEQADVVLASREDLAGTAFDADRPGDVAAALTDAGPHTAFVTLGEDGAFAGSTADAPWGEAAASHGGYAVDAVDATGAGDAFAAGVLAALSERPDSPSAVLDFATAVAALATTETGAMAALPGRGAVTDLRDGG